MTIVQKKILAVDYDDCLAPTTECKLQMFSGVADAIGISPEVAGEYYERSKIIDDFSPQSFTRLLREDSYSLPDGFEDFVQSFFVDPDLSYNEKLINELRQLKKQRWELRILSAGNNLFQGAKISMFLKKHTELFDGDNVVICPKASDKIDILRKWSEQDSCSRIVLIDDRESTVRMINEAGLDKVSAVVHRIGDEIGTLH